MFSKACAIASQFTRPVVISSRTVAGVCASQIGACIVVNRHGWVVTAGHLIGLIRKQQQAARGTRQYWNDVRQMEHDISSMSPYRKKKVRRFEKPCPQSIENHSVWWGVDGARLKDVHAMPSADLAVGRLEPFDPESVPRYPVFKSPGPDYAPGRSLCRLGFAFHQITPSYDEDKNAFVLPEGSVPLPLFPLEGMFTRVLIVQAPENPGGAAGKFIETSSPGLRGQSGGPLFDVEGVVWGLQSHTRHYPLGFEPSAPDKAHARGQVEHQFLNAGVGVHVEPILQILESHGIEHALSDFPEAS